MLCERGLGGGGLRIQGGGVGDGGKALRRVGRAIGGGGQSLAQGGAFLAQAGGCGAVAGVIRLDIREVAGGARCGILALFQRIARFGFGLSGGIATGGQGAAGRIGLAHCLARPVDFAGKRFGAVQAFEAQHAGILARRLTAPEIPVPPP